MLLLLEQVSQLQIHTTGDPQGRSCLVRTQDKVNKLQKTDFQSPGKKIHMMSLWFLRIISTPGSLVVILSLCTTVTGGYFITVYYCHWWLFDHCVLLSLVVFFVTVYYCHWCFFLSLCTTVTGGYFITVYYCHWWLFHWWFLFCHCVLLSLVVISSLCTTVTGGYFVTVYYCHWWLFCHCVLLPLVVCH